MFFLTYTKIKVFIKILTKTFNKIINQIKIICISLNYNNQNLNSLFKNTTQNMTSPVIFIFNIRRSVYEAFGTSHFNSIKNIYKNIHLLPIVNNLD